MDNPEKIIPALFKGGDALHDAPNNATEMINQLADNGELIGAQNTLKNIIIAGKLSDPEETFRNIHTLKEHLEPFKKSVKELERLLSELKKSVQDDYFGLCKNRDILHKKIAACNEQVADFKGSIEETTPAMDRNNKDIAELETALDGKTNFLITHDDNNEKTIYETNLSDGKISKLETRSTYEAYKGWDREPYDEHSVQHFNRPSENINASGEMVHFDDLDGEEGLSDEQKKLAKIKLMELIQYLKSEVENLKKMKEKRIEQLPEFIREKDIEIQQIQANISAMSEEIEKIRHRNEKMFPGLHSTITRKKGGNEY